jgi:hypothetical protein
LSQTKDANMERVIMKSSCDIVPIWRFDTLREPIQQWRSCFQATIHVGVAFHVIIWVSVVKVCSLWGGPLDFIDYIDLHFIQVSNFVRWKLKVDYLVNLDDYYGKSMTKEWGHWHLSLVEPIEMNNIIQWNKQKYYIIKQHI